MLIYSEEGKKAVLNILEQSRGYGQYSKTFRDELHKKLSYLHLRDDKITLTRGEYSSEVNYEKKSVKFSCEFSVCWENGTFGGLVWHEFNHSFGLHS